MSSLRLALVIATTLGVAADARACPPMTTTQVVRTSANATLAEGGGILLETRQAADPTLGVAQPLLGASGGVVKATWESLAPNLTLVRPPAGTTGPLEVRNGSRVVLSVTVGGKVPAHAPPRLKAITGSAVRPDAVGGRPRPSLGVPVSSTTIELAAPPPADVVALVVYDASGIGRAWFAPSGTTYTITTGGKACAATFLPSFIGDQLAVAWVDDRGRVSPKSKLVRVRQRARS